MNKIPATDVSETEDQLIRKAQDAVSGCNWVVGECASKWTEKYAKGRTDGDFGELVGMSSDQVFQRRRVWETFSDVSSDYPSLKWSHFYVALNWDDAPECLLWAKENEATVAEMKAWRRLQHGEDLSVEAEYEDALISYVPTDPKLVQDPGASAGAASPTNSASRAGNAGDDQSLPTVTAAARDSGAGDYAPFRQGASSPAPKEQPADVAVAERPKPSAKQTVQRMTITLERMNNVLTPEFREEFKRLPDKFKNRFIKAVGDLSSKAAELI